MVSPEFNVWTAPAAPGSYKVFVTVWDSGGAFGGALSDSDSVTVTVRMGNSAPVIESLAASQTQMFPGTAINVTASATDTDGDPISYA